jgi:hypothetical protein
MGIVEEELGMFFSVQIVLFSFTCWLEFIDRVWQCCGTGYAWIRIIFGTWIRIRIRVTSWIRIRIKNKKKSGSATTVPEKTRCQLSKNSA